MNRILLNHVIHGACCAAIVTILSASFCFSQFYGWKFQFSSPGLSVGINPFNINTLYSEGTSSGGSFYVSHNRGVSWQLVGNVGISSIRQILVCPNDTFSILCAPEVGSVGMRKSTDGGATWRTVLPGYFIDGESIALDPVHPDTLYAGRFDGKVYRSTDRGETWTLIGTNGGPLCAMAVRQDSANIILSGNGSGHIVKSTNGGATWRTVQAEKSGDEIPKIVFSPSDPMIGYATSFGNDNDPTLAAWKTTDGGEHWTKTSLQGLAIWSLALAANDPNVVYTGTFTDLQHAVFKSTDGGDTWSVISHGLQSGDLYSWNLKVHPLNSNEVWMAATSDAGEAGVYKIISTSTGIQGVVIDGSTGDTVRHGFFKNKQTGGETVDLRISRGRFTTGYFEDSHTTYPTLHVESYPYYVKDTVVMFVVGSTVNTTIYLDPLPSTAIQGIIKNRVTQDGVVGKVTLSYTDPFGNHILVDSTDPSGHFSFTSLYPSQSPLVKYNYVLYQPVLPFAKSVDSSIVVDSSGLNLVAEVDTVDVLVVGAAGSNDYYAAYISALESLGISGYAWNSNQDGLAPLRMGRTFRKKTVIYYSGDRLTSLTTAELDSLKACLDAGCKLFLTGQNIVEKNDTSDFIRNYLGVRFEANVNTAVMTGTPGNLFDGMFWFNTDGDHEVSRDRITIVNPRVKPIVRYYIDDLHGIAGVSLDCTGNFSTVVLFGFGFEAISSAQVSNTQLRATILQKIFDYFSSTDTAGFETVATSVGSDWNLVSVPMSFSPTTVPAVFPSAISRAFGFQNNYVPTNTMEIGNGYWLQFPAPTAVTICGLPITTESVSVHHGWNIIGSISVPIAVNSITSNPLGLVTSQFLSFDGTYFESDTIQPGHGYWVQVSGAGTLYLSASASAGAANAIRIVPTNERPPSPPTDADISHPLSHIPHRFALEQNYPNTFNLTTNFRFSILDVGMVTLRVYDMLGRETATLVNEAKEPGEYTVAFDAANLPSGVYTYRLRAGSFTDVKKMLLLR
ncbi:MAG: T9SS type A sorting domain-containing protein [Ignavibacteriae bacterium]|nr:T9SS type A sorting domain-containing protein [Ignavibacteriota bacterium]